MPCFFLELRQYLGALQEPRASLSGVMCAPCVPGQQIPGCGPEALGGLKDQVVPEMER